MTTALEVNKIKWFEESDIYYVNLTGQKDSGKELKGSFPLCLHLLLLLLLQKY